MIYPDFGELIKLAARPNRLGVASARRTSGSAAGSYASPVRGQGLSFHEVREYRPGDDIRNIDWRVTARANKPHMKVFTEERERTVMVCVDANASMRFGTRGTFKSVQAARAAALIGHLANGSHDRVGGLLFGDVPEGLQVFNPVRSRKALWQALRALAREPVGKFKNAVPLEIALRRLDRVTPAGSLIFIISDFYPVSKGFATALASLRRRCDIVLIRIDDPADGLIPSLGSLRFSDNVGISVLIDTDLRSGQEAYAQQWQEGVKKLNSICAQQAIPLIGLQTAREVQGDLVPNLRRLIKAVRR